MYQPKNFDHLLGMPGLSDALLKNHFTLYQGYVKNFNVLNDTLIAMEKDGKFGTAEFAELNRRLGWEFNGMRLHELYFSAMAHPARSSISDNLRDAMVKEWGSRDMWEKDFKAMGAMRGIGWVVLYYDPEEKRLFNVWINEHDVGHLAGGVPLLVMDVFEHAYMIDYGLKRADYIEAFFRNINWEYVNARFEKYSTS